MFNPSLLALRVKNDHYQECTLRNGMHFLSLEEKKTIVPIVPFIIAHTQQLETSFSSISLPHPGEEEEEGGGSKGRNGATCGCDASDM